MAFVRWRKNCAELLATVYEKGRSRQVLLANLPYPYVPPTVREEISSHFPDIPVDWAAVDHQLARGPKEHPAAKAHMTWADAEHLLRDLSWRITRSQGWTEDAAILVKAANVLTAWRTGGVSDPLETGEMSSDDRPHDGRGPPALAGLPTTAPNVTPDPP